MYSCINMEGRDRSVTNISASESEYNPDDCTSSEDEILPLNNSKKRIRNDKHWARNNRKMCRVKGQEYINLAGKSVPPRSTGPDCKCKRQCYTKVSDDVKHILIQSFNELKDKDQQDAYLCGLITASKVQRRRPRTGEGNLRGYSFFYKVCIYYGHSVFNG